MTTSEAESAGAKLRRAVEQSVEVLRGLSEAESARPREAGKWAPREIVGHLIDSAANNHQRFVRAQFQPDLVFTGYEQDEWVLSQRYREAPWAELVELWRLYNGHLARVMDAIPEDIRVRQTLRHNYDRIAWREFRPGEPATLDDLLHDYVAHLEHHLAQIRRS